MLISESIWILKWILKCKVWRGIHIYISKMRSTSWIFIPKLAGPCRQCIKHCYHKKKSNVILSFLPGYPPNGISKNKYRNYHSVVFISYFKIINFKIELFTKINHKNFSPHQCLYLHESPHIRSHNGQSLT